MLLSWLDPANRFAELGNTCLKNAAVFIPCVMTIFCDHFLHVISQVSNLDSNLEVTTFANT
jgi:hypothetical protein